MTSIKPNTTEIAAKVMDGEAILINLTTGIYYSLDESSGVLWGAIGEGTDTAALADVLVDAYGIAATQAAADAQAFIDRLLSEQLVLVADDTPENPLRTSAAKFATSAYSVPEFERFDDMAEMFALDPPLPGLTNKN